MIIDIPSDKQVIPYKGLVIRMGKFGMKEYQAFPAKEPRSCTGCCLLGKDDCYKVPLCDTQDDSYIWLDVSNVPY